MIPIPPGCTTVFHIPMTSDLMDLPVRPCIKEIRGCNLCVSRETFISLDGALLGKQGGQTLLEFRQTPKGKGGAQQQ